MGAGLTVHDKDSETKSPVLKHRNFENYTLGKAKAGENVNFTDMLGKIDKAGAKVQFRHMGKN